MVNVLVLFDSRSGLIEQLAEAVSAGVRTAGAECVQRRVDDAIPHDLLRADAIVVGSPNWTGITGKLKEWWDHSGDLWQSGALDGKVGAAFTAGYSRSGGNEATLLQITHLLVGHGLVFVGLPWTDRMRRSGSYYGATAHGDVTDEDIVQARALGFRVVQLAERLARTSEKGR